MGLELPLGGGQWRWLAGSIFRGEAVVGGVG